MARIYTYLGERDESWPPTLARATAAIAEARHKYEPVLAAAHTLDLLGLSEAMQAELARRRPGIDAMRVNTERPRASGLTGNVAHSSRATQKGGR